MFNGLVILLGMKFVVFFSVMTLLAMLWIYDKSNISKKMLKFIATFCLVSSLSMIYCHAKPNVYYANCEKYTTFKKVENNTWYAVKQNKGALVSYSVNDNAPKAVHAYVKKSSDGHAYLKTTTYKVTKKTSWLKTALIDMSCPSFNSGISRHYTIYLGGHDLGQ